MGVSSRCSRGPAPSTHDAGLETDQGRFELLEALSRRLGWISSLKDPQKLPHFSAQIPAVGKVCRAFLGQDRPGILWAL